MALSPTYKNDSKTIYKNILPEDGTNWVTLVDNTTATKSVRIEALNLCTDNTATVNIQFSILKGGVNTVVGTARAVTLAGTDGAATRIDCLSIIGSLAPDGVRVLELGAGDILQAKSLVAIVAAKTAYISGWFMKFEADA